MRPSLRVIPGNRSRPAPTSVNRYSTERDDSNASVNHADRKRQSIESSAVIVMCVGPILAVMYGVAWALHWFGR